MNRLNFVWIARAFAFITSIAAAGGAAAQGFTADLVGVCADLETKTRLYQRSLKNRGFVDPPNRPRKGAKRPRRTYRGCEMNTPWISNLKSVLCESGQPRYFSESELSAIEIPRVLLFYIGGASDFNAARAEDLLDPANLDGSEGNDLAGKNWSGNFLYHAFKQLGDELRAQTQINYYAGSGFKRLEAGPSAKACLRDSFKYLKTLSKLSPSADLPKFALAGYSNGGALSVQYQEELAKEEGVALDLVFAIDPVPQTHKYLFSSHKTPIGQKTDITKKLVSVYQTTDYGSMPLLKLRGRKVINADLNLEINCENWGGRAFGNVAEHMRCSGEKNHVSMMYSKTVLDLFTKELRSLYDWP